MTLLVCLRCTTKFSVGAEWCPGCTSTQFVEEGQEMPKNTVHGGSSNAAEPDEATPVAAPVVEPEAAPEPEAVDVVEVVAEDAATGDEDTPNGDTEAEADPEPAPVRRGRGRAQASAGEDD